MTSKYCLFLHVSWSASGVRALLELFAQHNELNVPPYSCGEIFPEVLPENEGKPENPKYTIHNDEAMPPFDKITGLVKFKDYPEFTR